LVSFIVLDKYISLYETGQSLRKQIDYLNICSKIREQINNPITGLKEENVLLKKELENLKTDYLNKFDNIQTELNNHIIEINKLKDENDIYKRRIMFRDNKN